MAAPPYNTQNLYDYMEAHMQKNIKFGSHSQHFLPKLAFDAVTTGEVIRDIVANDDDLYMNSQEVEEFATKVHKHGRKIFATCVYADLPMTCVKALLDDGVTDVDMPLCDVRVGRYKQKRKFNTSFIPNQKRFSTAYFSMDAIQNLDDTVSVPIHYSAIRSSSYWLGKGSFGDVWKVKIHPEHCAFSSGANGHDQFAMKVTEQGPYERREQKFHVDMATAGLNHPHLVKCLTSFTFEDHYHMIYELANCDLEVFMQNNKDPRLIPGMTELSLAQQLYGLAAALELVHDQGESQTSEPGKLNIQRTNGGKTGYIHDIKPENILVFVYDGNLHWFRLSDFSCAKVVDWLVIVSGVNGIRESQKTKSSSGTPIYRAPECFLAHETSRPYDLWSLGCVYLELLVWFVEGLAGLEAFRASRMAPTIPDGARYEGFFSITDSEPHLRQPVLDKMDEIQKQCTGELSAIARMIPKLLQVEPKSRPTAAQLVDSLKHLHDDFDPTPKAQNASHPSSPFLVSEPDLDADLGDMFIVTKPT